MLYDSKIILNNAHTGKLSAVEPHSSAVSAQLPSESDSTSWNRSLSQVSPVSAQLPSESDSTSRNQSLSMVSPVSAQLPSESNSISRNQSLSQVSPVFAQLPSESDSISQNLVSPVSAQLPSESDSTSQNQSLSMVSPVSAQLPSESNSISRNQSLSQVSPVSAQLPSESDSTSRNQSLSLVSPVSAQLPSESDSANRNQGLSLTSASESEPVSFSGIVLPSTIPSRTSRFPYLDTGKMNDRQKFLLECRLFEDSSNITSKFSDLIHYTIVSLKANPGVTVTILSARLANLGAYKPVRAHKPLLRDRLEVITNCTTIDEVFLILPEYYSFFNYGIIQRIITWFPTPDDERRLEEYTADFKVYCKRRTFECPSDIFGHICEGKSAIVVKTEDNWDPYEKIQGKVLGWVLQLQNALAKILQVETETLNLCQIDKGCVELLFTVSFFVEEDVFPLSDKQERSLVSIEVAKLTCGRYSFPSKVIM